MSISINRQTTQKNIVVEHNKTQKQQATNNQSKVSNDNHSDSVQLTSQAKNLNKMQKQSAGEPQINKQRIEALKAAITNGDYKINSERLAQRLSNFEGDFSKAFS